MHRVHRLAVQTWRSCARSGASLRPWRAIAQGRSQFMLRVGAASTALLASATVNQKARNLAQCELEHTPKVVGILPGTKDTFGGIILDAEGLPSEPHLFEEALEISLAYWRQSGIRGVWLKVPIEKVRLIAVAVENGFVFHHAERGHCTLTHWLPKDIPSPLPPNASHQVGVGALVVNDEGKVLFVQEAVGPSAGRDMWKIPTGLVNARENLKDAVERELWEETGLEGKFEKVIAFRHGHSAPWGKSDLFFICLCRVAGATGRDESFKLQASEIAKAKWGDFQEFLLQSPYPRDMPVWAAAYGSCVGEDGVVGNVPGINPRLIRKGRGDSRHEPDCVYTAAKL